MRPTVERKILGVDATTKKLKFEVSQEMLPDAIEFMTRALRQLGSALKGGVKNEDDIMKLLTVIQPSEARDLLAMINRSSTRLLATTVVIADDEDGKRRTYELMKAPDRSDLFELREDLFVPLCVWNGVVTFKGYFPDLARFAGETRGESS